MANPWSSPPGGARQIRRSVDPPSVRSGRRGPLPGVRDLASQAPPRLAGLLGADRQWPTDVSECACRSFMEWRPVSGAPQAFGNGGVVVTMHGRSWRSEFPLDSKGDSVPRVRLVLAGSGNVFAEQVAFGLRK